MSWDIALHLVGEKRIPTTARPNRINALMYYYRLKQDPEKYREYRDKANARRRASRKAKRQQTQ